MTVLFEHTMIFIILGSSGVISHHIHVLSPSGAHTYHWLTYLCVSAKEIKGLYDHKFDCNCNCSKRLVRSECLCASAIFLKVILNAILKIFDINNPPKWSFFFTPLFQILLKEQAHMPCNTVG